MKVIALIFKVFSWVVGSLLLLSAFSAMSHVADSTLTAEIFIGLCFAISFYLSGKIEFFIAKIFRDHSKSKQDDSLLPRRFFVFFVLFITFLLLNGSVNVGDHKTVLSKVADKDRSRTKRGYTYDITLSYKNESVNIYVDADVWNHYAIGDCVMIGVQRGMFGFYVVKSHSLELNIPQIFRPC